MAEARYRGEVVKLDRGYPLVRLEDGELLRCEHATALVKGERRRAVIGDVVEVAVPPAHDKGVIEAIAPRTREFVRKDPTERAVPQVLAANFERVIVAQPVGEVNLRCMELLDQANTETFGTPEPTQVARTIEPGPFIVVSGHDLLDLKLVLDQAAGRGVNVYTHGELLPAHAYPLFKQYPHLRGNLGTAWQNQREEFANLPAPILFTTNCLMPPAASYADRVFTTGPVAFPGMARIDANKDFGPVIESALELGGFAEPRAVAAEEGAWLTTGFGHGAILGSADAVVDAVKQGAISHFFLVGGCDGARPGRGYFREFVRRTPVDSVVLTLACGKFRFNDLDLGTVAGLPRLMDMGQCNDAYGAIRVAVALAEAFECGVNDLPLTLVLSWYEQKAVSILLSLLNLGIKGIYLGPTLPAFVSPGVLDVLVREFDVRPISTPEEDLAVILA